MAKEIDYEELSDKKISEIKEAADKKDLDLKKLLKAEKKNKDRKTLKKWINSQIDKEKSEKKEKDKKKKGKKDKKGKKKGKKSLKKKHRKKKRGRKKSAKPVASKTMPFLIGLLVGGLLVGLLMWGMASPGSSVSEGDIDPSTVKEDVNSFLTEMISSEQVDFSLGEVDSEELSDFYVLPLDVETPRGTQSISVYVSKKSGLMFLGNRRQPIDIESGQPYGQTGTPQTGTTQPPQQPQ